MTVAWSRSDMVTPAGAGRPRFARALRWAILRDWGDGVMSTALTFMLAVLLGPSEFGTAVVALTFVQLIELFAAQGYVGSIVQRKDLVSRDLDTAFWIVAALGLVLATLCFALAPRWAALYEIPRLSAITRLLSLSIVIRGLTVVQEAKLARDMDFRSLAIRSNLAAAVSGMVGVTVALLGFGAWAIALQSLTRSVVGCGVLWHAARWTPALRFDAGSARALTSFSLRYFPASLFDFLSRSLEPFIIGALFGPLTVGLYRMITRIVEAVIMLVTRALWNVAFPYFSDSQDNRTELKRRLLMCLHLAVLLSWPALAVIGAESHAILAVIGERWEPASSALAVLSLCGALSSLTLFTSPLLFATNRPGQVSIVMAIVCFAMCGSMATVGFMLRAATPEHQVIATAYTRLGVHALVFVPISLYVMHAVSGVGSEVLRYVLPSAAASVMAAGTDLFLQSLPEPVTIPTLALLAARSLIALLVAAGFLWVCDRSLRTLVLADRLVTASLSGTSHS